MNRKLVVICLIIIYPALILSQSDFRDGYIITNNFDTIYGLLNYNKIKKHLNCEFRGFTDSSSQFYSPFQINSFRYIDDKYYISKKIRLKKSYDKYTQISHVGNNGSYETEKVWYSDTTYFEKEVFLEFLVKGKINLYYYLDNLGASHYFMEKDLDSLIDLTSEINKYIDEYGNELRKSNESYKRDIYFLMKDAPELQTEIRNISLDHKNLINITSEYHNYVCKDHECIIYKKNIKPHATKIGFYSGIGIGYKEISIPDNKTIFLKDIGNYLVGANVHFINFLPQFERLSFKLNSDFAWYNYLENQDQKTFTYNNVKAGLLFIYTFSTKPNRTFVDLGFAGNYGFNGKVEYSDSNFKDLSDEWRGYSKGEFMLGIGYDFLLNKTKSNRVNIELLYSQNIIRTELKNYTASLIIGYEF
jgi:hypothetical protein